MSLPALVRPEAVRPEVASEPLTTVERLTTVSADLIEEFLAVYRRAFAPLEVLAAARQALTDDEFRDEMVDPRVIKFVARNETGEATALAFMATDLSVVPWVSVPYFAKKYPDHYARGAIFYVGALLVRAERQGGPWMKIVVDDMIKYVAEHRGVAAFDCCGFNSETVKLPDTLARATHRLAYAETGEIDVQRYYAYAMEGLR